MGRSLLRPVTAAARSSPPGLLRRPVAAARPLSARSRCPVVRRSAYPARRDHPGASSDLPSRVVILRGRRLSAIVTSSAGSGQCSWWRPGDASGGHSGLRVPAGRTRRGCGSIPEGTGWQGRSPRDGMIPLSVALNLSLSPLNPRGPQKRLYTVNDGDGRRKILFHH